jgi:hypothetical protein
MQKHKKNKTKKGGMPPSPLRKVVSASSASSSKQRSLSPIREEEESEKGKTMKTSPSNTTSPELEGLTYSSSLTPADCKKRIEIITFFYNTERKKHNKILETLKNEKAKSKSLTNQNKKLTRKLSRYTLFR